MRRAVKYALEPQERLEKIRLFARDNPADFIERKYKKHGSAREETVFKTWEDDTGEILDFNLLWAQRRAYNIYQEEKKKGKPVRLWFLKSRRVGLTTMFAADEFVDAWSRNNRRIGIVAHNDDRARRILAMCKFFNKHLPKELRMQLSKDATNGIKFAHHDSEILIGTCKEPAKVRGDGLQRAHLSEAAYYKQYFNLVMQEVAMTIAPSPHTAIVIETTGKARGSQAHAHYLASREGQTVYRTDFLPWLEDPACVRPFESDLHKQVIMDEIKQIEPRLWEKNRYHKLSPEQAYWAYYMFCYKGELNYDFFIREFPYDEEDAWSNPGSSFFGDTEIGQVVPNSDYVCYTFGGRFINKLFKSFSELERVDKVDHNGGTLHIKLWGQALQGRQYIIASDVSLGETGGTYSAGYVIDAESREMMACYHGRIRPDEHAFLMASLGWMYNTALVCPEVNPGGGGMQMLTDLQRMHYPHIYVHRFRDSVKGLIYSTKVGWWTTQTSRNLALGELRKMLHDAARERFQDPGMFKDKCVLDEMRSFHTDPETGRAEASEDAYDDRIFGLAIAHRVAADEVTSGTSKDIYLSYESLQPVGQTMVDVINSIIEAREGPDAADVVKMLQSNDFMLNEDGMIEWD